MARLVEQLLTIPEVRGLNPAIGKIYLFAVNCIEKKKEAWNGPFFKKNI